jgi:hypothetical protein
MRLSLHTLITRPSPVDFDIHRVGVPGQRNLTNTRLQFESSVVQVPFKSNASAEKLNTKQAQNSIPAADLGASAFTFFLRRRIVAPARSCG